MPTPLSYSGLVPDAPPLPVPRPRGLVPGRLRGTPLIITPTWFVSMTVLLVLATRAVEVFLPGWPGPWRLAAAAAMTAMLVVGVVVHELAHGEAGRALGRAPQWYVLTFIGGYTAFPMKGETPRVSALVTLAGPAANAVLGAACLFGAWALRGAWAGGALAWEPGPAGLGLVVLSLGAFTNLALGAFNLLPGLPLDGGRLVEAAVWRATGSRARGTAWAAVAGLALAPIGLVAVLALPALGVVRLSGLSIALALVVLAQVGWVAFGHLSQARRRRRAEGIVLSALASPVDVLPAHHTLADLDALRAARGAARAVLVRLGDGAGAPPALGLLDELLAHRVAPADRATTALGAMAAPVPPACVLHDARGTAAVLEVERAQEFGPVLVLLGPPGAPERILGVLDVAAVGRALAGRPGPGDAPAP